MRQTRAGSVAARFGLLVTASVVVLVAAVGVGSVYIAPNQIIAALFSRLMGQPIADTAVDAILWTMRLPRALLAFVAGSALALSGALMQSVLQNPLASSYTLGVSSGAAVGASLAILTGASFFGALTLPFFGLTFGLLTVFLAVATASRLDKSMSVTAIVLTGMAFSMFANAIISFIVSWSRENSQQIIFWQMGSFSFRDWQYPAILLPVLLAVLVVALLLCREMDIMTFGEEQAKTSGVETLRIKWALLVCAAVLTGCTVSLVGVIGFVDLFTPHVARKLFGSRHRLVIPASVLLGGCFMVVCDLVARTVAAPIELPVGAVTSALGAPFFVYLYFKRRR